MFKGFQSRLVLIVLLMFTAVYIVLPTYQKYFQLDYSNLTKEEKEAVDSKAIKLGLDLQGGMYVLLELDEKARLAMGESSNKQFISSFSYSLAMDQYKAIYDAKL